jgi:hypothetical protein
VHQLCSRLFGATVWKLLIIKPFSQRKVSKKFETENCVGIWGCSWCCKGLGKSDLLEIISQFSKLKCERNWFLSRFLFWKFKQIAKLWVWKEIQLSPQCVHSWANGTCYTSLSMKQGSLFCFVCWDLPTRVFHAALLVSLESSWWVRVRQLGLRLFGATAVEAIDYWTVFSMKI